MSDELERLLRDVPGRVPVPRPSVTRRVRERLLGLAVLRRAGVGRVSASVVVALAVGMLLGYWVIPQEEPAIGAADPPPVTIDAQPRVLRMWGGGGVPFTVTGTVITRAAGERVVVEENVCGSGWFEVAGTMTEAGGRWTVSEGGYPLGPLANALLRARWRGATSIAVRIGVRPNIWLRKKQANLYTVDVNAIRPLAGRTIQLERYLRSSGRWVVVRKVKLAYGSYGMQTTATFRVRLPRRTIIRAVLPAAQARPCYLAGYSRLETVG